MTRPESHTFEHGGGIPNSRLPVLVRHGVEGARGPQDCIESVPLPDADPVLGPGGPLTESWRE